MVGITGYISHVNVIKKYADVEIDGQYTHIIGMTLRDKKAKLYVLEPSEERDYEEECRNRREETNRERLKRQYENPCSSLFRSVRKFQSNGISYDTEGGSSSSV